MVKNLFIVSIFIFFVGKTVLAQSFKTDSLKKVELWYDDEYQVRKLKSVFHVLKVDENIMHGKMISYYESGKVISEGEYIMNEPRGPWKYYFEDGKLKMEADLKNSKEGYWKYLYENGSIKQEGNIIDNKQEGYWKFYFENGNTKSEGFYKEGVKEAKWNYYYEDAALKAEVVYKNGGGYYKGYFVDGGIKMEGEIVNNQSEGNWKYYYPSGKLQAEGYELHGVKNGHWNFYFENGQRSSHGNYVDGKQHDDWTYFYDNGTISSLGAHYEGDKDGHWELFHKNGAFKGESDYKRGDGEHKEYYENGVLKVKGQIKDNKNNAVWFYYYADGSLEGKCDFNEGKGNYIGYYKNGNVRMKGRIEDNLKIGIWELFNEDGSLAGYYKTLYDESGNEIFKKKSVNDDDFSSDSIITNPAVVKLPDYKYKPKKKSKIKWFNSKINEYEGLIIGTNPLDFVNSKLPVSVEYYYQERMGFEMEYTIIRNPFFLSDNKIPENIVFNRGQAIDFAQRLYEPAKAYGMLYYGHRVRFKTNVFSAFATDTLPIVPAVEKINARENSVEYLLMFGNRVFSQSYSRAGFTFDIFITAGVGYRWFMKQYTETPTRKDLFKKVPQEKIFIPYRLEFSFGYLF